MRTQSETSKLLEEGAGGGGEHKSNLAANSFGFILIGWEGGVNLRVIYSEDTPMRPRI